MRGRKFFPSHQSPVTSHQSPITNHQSSSVALAITLPKGVLRITNYELRINYDSSYNP
ncbi:MAG: hypothetical protein F6K61_05235 [Sphaerospermopsis sp. SIO1G1]|nr:hypothetical protein [Sphaerospermopsis sp. SIO1G1]